MKSRLFNTKQTCSLTSLCSKHNCQYFSEMDLIPAFATFFSCLFIRLELGILIGIGVNVMFLLYASARPSVRVERAVVSTLRTNHQN
jgi:MFS superfamily sulfate permease-like transporter